MSKTTVKGKATNNFLSVAHLNEGLGQEDLGLEGNGEDPLASIAGRGRVTG